MESYIPISFLNDFIFCPRSIYFHNLHAPFKKQLYHAAPQAKGLVAHRAIDEKTYSHSKDWLIGINVYSEVHGLCGKIDLYNKKNKVLRERKRKITTIYDGYYLQVYAQYICLIEMGYEVDTIELYDSSHNKTHAIPLPKDYPSMMDRLTDTIQMLRSFRLNDPFSPNPDKCKACIYSALCDCAAC